MRKTARAGRLEFAEGYACRGSVGAAFSGKLKMVFQSVTILVIIVYVNYRGWLIGHAFEPWARGLRDFCIWATVAITIFSGLLYVRRGVAAYRAGGVA